MHSRSPLWVIRFLVILLAAAVPAATASAQSYVPTAQELDQLLAPVALYPDALLAQITSACTDPQEILDVEDWLQRNPGLSGNALSNAAQAQGFDPAFVALVNFPQVLAMMAQNIDDYAAIGAAFAANPDSVMDSVQRLRELAYGSGALRSGPQQQVVVENYQGRQIIEIQPANPQIVYVPQYDPGVIYSRVGLAPSFITFGVGIGLVWGVGHPWGWRGWGWNWRTRALLYNRLTWRSRYNRYRPPRPIYRPRPPNYGHRPVIRPVPARPVRPGRPTIQPVRPTPGRPTRPTPGRPTIQPVRPSPTRPTRPNPGRPTIQPVKPNQPQPRPGTRPSNGVRRAPVPSHSRPAPPNGSRPGGRPQPPSQSRPSRPATGAKPAPKPRPQTRPAPKPPETQQQ